MIKVTNERRGQDGQSETEYPDHSASLAQRILGLLMAHANGIAVTLTQFPQYYEPLFLERDIKGHTVSIVDEWCCGYVKGIALDPLGWRPLVKAQSDWFEGIAPCFVELCEAAVAVNDVKRP